MTSLAGTAVPVAAQAATARVDDLHRRYGTHVLEYCIRHLRSREEGEDAAQTVFLNAYRSLAKGTEPQSEGAWLFAIAQHVVSHRHRTNSRRLRFEVAVDADDLAYLAVAPPLDDAPDLTGLVDALSELPTLERRALVLRELRGLTYKEMASELGVSGNAVETLLTRGRRRLAHRMQDLRRTGKRALSVCLPWPSLQSLGSGAAVKGLASVAAVGLVTTVAIPLHHAMTKPPARVPAISRHAAARKHTAQALRPISPRIAPSVSVIRKAHKRAAPRVTRSASPPPPTFPIEMPPPAASVADAGAQPVSDAAVADAQPVGDATTAPAPQSAGDATSPAPELAGPPGQSHRSLKSDPNGPPPIADRGSSADDGGQSPHGQPG